MPNEKLLLLLSRSRYDALPNYLMELGKAFTKMGYEVEYIDGRVAGFEERIYKATSKNEYKAIIACNAILTGYDMLVQKDSVFCSLMFDHPVQLFERIEIADEKVLIMHCDLKGAEYIARYCPNVGSVGFVPLSGSFVEDLVPYKERKYNVVFTGSYNDPSKLYEEKIASLSESDIIVADEILAIMKENVSLTMQEAFQIFLDNRGIVITDRQFHVIMAQLRNVEAYMRAWLREQVIKAILDAGIKVHIFGENWDKLDTAHPENIVRMQGCGEEALKVLADTKISLNVMPWFRGGFQERNASAMLCGAISLTDTSTYIEENFQDGKDILIYDGNRPESAAEIIKKILADDELGEKIAGAGYEKAHKYHTWENRAKEIMEAIDEKISLTP